MAVNVEMAEYLTALIAAKGQFSSGKRFGVGSRDLEALPSAIRELITTKGGVGSAIDPQLLL